MKNPLEAARAFLASYDEPGACWADTETLVEALRASISKYEAVEVDAYVAPSASGGCAGLIYDPDMSPPLSGTRQTILRTRTQEPTLLEAVERLDAAIVGLASIAGPDAVTAWQELHAARRALSEAIKREQEK